MRLGDTLIKEQLFFRKELMERVDWFIRLRWWFAAAGLVGSGLLLLILPRPPALKLTAVFLAVAGYNSLFALFSRRLHANRVQRPEPFLRFAHAQISLDLAALFVITYLTGGLRSPISVFVVFHLILAGSLMSPFSGYLYGAIILVFLGLMTLLQVMNPQAVPQALFHAADPSARFSAAQGLFHYLIYAAAVLITAALTTSIKRSLRAKGRELLAVSKALTISNEKLKALYEMVNTMGRCSDLQTLMDSATRNTAAIMGVNGCAIKLLDAHGQHRRVAATHGLSDDVVTKTGLDGQGSDIIEGISHGVNDISASGRHPYTEDVAKEGIAAMVCLPLRVDRLTLGTFCVYSGMPAFFKPEDVRFFELIADLTALAMANLKSELNKTWFLHKAAHQLRSPLGTVFSVLKTLGDGYLGPLTAQQQDALKRCERRIDLLQGMLGDLLEISIRRTQNDKMALVPMDLSAVLANHLPPFRIQAAEKNIDVLLTAEPQLPRVAASESLLDDLLINLLSNALKYTPAGGKVRILLDTDTDGRLRCRIRDTGIGIPAIHQASLFSEFFRAPNASAYTEEGTGLGLVIVKEILDRLQGSIHITSSEGAGTEVVFLLPALDEENS